MTPKDPIAALDKLADIHREAVAAGQLIDVPDPDRWRPASTIGTPGWYWMREHPDSEPAPVRVWVYPDGTGYGYDCGCRMGRLPESAELAGPLTPPEDTR